MARRMRIKWNVKDGSFEDLRRLPGVEAEVAKVVARVKASAGGGKREYAGGTEDGGDRVRGYVVTTNLSAMHAESSDHALQRALAEGASSD